MQQITHEKMRRATSERHFTMWYSLLDT